LLHGRVYLTRVDIAGFLVLLSLETGMEIECLAISKPIACAICSRGYVEIEYRKRRAHSAQWKRLRVRDGASSTPGGLVRLLIKLTARARIRLATDQLFAWWNGYRLVAHARLSALATMFVARHGLVGDDGQALHLVLPRSRKTQKAEHYIRTKGQLEVFATGHTIAVAARHYADIPALRHIHEQTVADAFQDALEAALRPKLVRPGDEPAALTGCTAETAGPSTVTPAMLGGEQDVWLASCSNFYGSRSVPPKTAVPPRSGAAWNARMRSSPRVSCPRSSRIEGVPGRSACLHDGRRTARQVRSRTSSHSVPRFSPSSLMQWSRRRGRWRRPQAVHC